MQNLLLLPGSNSNTMPFIKLIQWNSSIVLRDFCKISFFYLCSKSFCKEQSSSESLCVCMACVYVHVECVHVVCECAWCLSACGVCVCVSNLCTVTAQEVECGWKFCLLSLWPERFHHRTSFHNQTYKKHHHPTPAFLSFFYFYFPFSSQTSNTHTGHSSTHTLIYTQQQPAYHCINTQ